jgi:YbbR domain-containing protein
VLVDVRGEVPRGYVRGDPFVDPEMITVTGPSSRVDALTEARVDIFLDFPREDVTRVRTPTFYNREGEISSVSSLNLSTREVQISVPIDEQAGFALKSVIVNFAGEPAPGYRVLSVSAEPDSVLVTGRPTQIEQVSFVGTETVDVNGLRESITVPAALNLPSGLELEEVQSVIVRVEIEPILTSDVVRQEPEIRNLGEGLTATLDVEQVVVFVAGPFDKLEALTDDDVRVTLDLFGLVTGTHQVEPEASVLVSDVAVRSIQPTAVTVVITTTEALTETTSQLPGRSLTHHTPASGPATLPLVIFAAAMLPPGWSICQRWKRKQPWRKNH